MTETYTKVFQAKDINGAESDWTYHTVTITKFKSNYSYMFEPLMHWYPLIARLLSSPEFEKLPGL